MKAIDTNVLVPYLVQDDPVQGKKAAAVIEGAASERDQILLGNIVLCETVWVLESAYGYAKAEIESVLAALLQSDTFLFEMKDNVWAALGDYRSSKADFADCLIGRVHRAFGSEPTQTFDTSLRKLPTFRVL